MNISKTAKFGVLGLSGSEMQIESSLSKTCVRNGKTSPNISALAVNACEVDLPHENNEAIPETTGEKKSQIVDPWNVESEGAIDYDKLIEQFGSQRLTQDLVDRIERVTGKKAHRFIRRGIFFSHRDLAQLLDLYEAGKKFYLYTGRGPSSEALHLGKALEFALSLLISSKCLL
jgi:hypothetical protein